mgnify:FL=1
MNIEDALKESVNRAKQLRVRAKVCRDYDLSADAAELEMQADAWETLAAEVRRLQEASNWIIVNDRLPEQGENVEVIVKARFSRGSFYDEYDESIFCVSKWQPLPQPPK